MAIESKEVEQKKDEILQQVNDALESEDWGGKTELLILELVFKNKLDCKIKLTKHVKQRCF